MEKYVCFYQEGEEEEEEGVTPAPGMSEANTPLPRASSNATQKTAEGSGEKVVEVNTCIS